MNFRTLERRIIQASRAGWTLLVTSALVASCNGDGPTDGDVDSTILRMRVHLLQSDFSPLNTTLTEDDVRTIITGVNDIWQQAGVTWEIESIVSDNALNAAVYESVLLGDLPATGPRIASILPQGSSSDSRWDVFYLLDLGGIAGGVYLAPITSVVVAELDPTGRRDLAGSIARILAHELGHSLGLQHVPCTPDGNLMAPGCQEGERTLLTSGQIDAARNQAAAGRPTVFSEVSVIN